MYRTRLALCVEANPLTLEANFDVMRPWSDDIFWHEGVRRTKIG